MAFRPNRERFHVGQRLKLTQDVPALEGVFVRGSIVCVVENYDHSHVFVVDEDTDMEFYAPTTHLEPYVESSDDIRLNG